MSGCFCVSSIINYLQFTTAKTIDKRLKYHQLMTIGSDMITPFKTAVEAYSRMLSRLEDVPSIADIKQAEELSRSPYLDGFQAYRLKDLVRKANNLRLKD